MNKIPDGNKVTAKKANRGRPKTFDRNHIIDIAMMSYWKEGPIAVSINEICKRAGVSKPSVYREFGSEDGLKRAAVSTYCDLLIAQFERGMDLESNFVQILDSLI